MTKTVAVRILEDMNAEVERRMLTDPAARDRDKASYLTMLIRAGMDAQTRKMTIDEIDILLAKGAPALSVSTQTWRDLQEELAERVELNAPATIFDHHCALCGQESCVVDCVVGRAVNCSGCRSTPYMAFAQALMVSDMQAMIEAANAELAFLEYLDGNVNYLWYIEEEEIGYVKDIQADLREQNDIDEAEDEAILIQDEETEKWVK